MSTYCISKERIWVIVTGGYSKYNQSTKTTQSITGPDTMMIIELGMIINIIIIT